MQLYLGVIPLCSVRAPKLGHMDRYVAKRQPKGLCAGPFPVIIGHMLTYHRTVPRTLR
jgi:hypothetical protein